MCEEMDGVFWFFYFYIGLYFLAFTDSIYYLYILRKEWLKLIGREQQKKSGHEMLRSLDQTQLFRVRRMAFPIVPDNTKLSSC